MRTIRCPIPPSRSSAATRVGDERGAILVHVAVAFLGLLAFSALSVDLGVLWVARTQAQNAADAASMGAAISLAYGDSTDLVRAASAAEAVAAANPVWGTAVPFAPSDFSEVPCPAGSPAGPGSCVRAEIRRDGGNGVPLSPLFSRLIGGLATGVRASSIAKVLIGNASNCVRPLAIPDRWNETSGTWTFGDVFERYQPGMPGVLLPPPVDEYIPPTRDSPGSGYRVQDMIGQQVTFDRGHIEAPEVRANYFYSLDLPRVGGTVPGDDEQYRANMTTCSGMTVSIGDTVQTMGAHQLSTQAAIADIIAQDPGAVWDGTRVVSSLGVSPRIIPVVLFDPDQFSQVPTPLPELYRAPMRVRNIVGFFVQGMEGGQITGVLVAAPGTVNPDGETITQEASFMRSVALVR